MRSLIASSAVGVIVRAGLQVAILFALTRLWTPTLLGLYVLITAISAFIVTGAQGAYLTFYSRALRAARHPGRFDHYAAGALASAAAAITLVLAFTYIVFPLSTWLLPREISAASSPRSLIVLAFIGCARMLFSCQEFRFRLGPHYSRYVNYETSLQVLEAALLVILACIHIGPTSALGLSYLPRFVIGTLTTLTIGSRCKRISSITRRRSIRYATAVMLRGYLGTIFIPLNGSLVNLLSQAFISGKAGVAAIGTLAVLRALGRASDLAGTVVFQVTFATQAVRRRADVLVASKRSRWFPLMIIGSNVLFAAALWAFWPLAARFVNVAATADLLTIALIFVFAAGFRAINSYFVGVILAVNEGRMFGPLQFASVLATFFAGMQLPGSFNLLEVSAFLFLVDFIQVLICGTYVEKMYRRSA